MEDNEGSKNNYGSISVFLVVVLLAFLALGLSELFSGTANIPGKKGDPESKVTFQESPFVFSGWMVVYGSVIFVLGGAIYLGFKKDEE